MECFAYTPLVQRLSEASRSSALTRLSKSKVPGSVLERSQTACSAPMYFTELWTRESAREAMSGVSPLLES